MNNNAIANDDWLTITNADQTHYFGRKNSGAPWDIDGVKNNGYGYIYKIHNEKTSKIELGKLFVMIKDCRKEEGVLYFTDMNGKRTGKNNYVLYGPTISDALAGAACTAYFDSKNEQKKFHYSESKWLLVDITKDKKYKFFLKRSTIKKTKKDGKDVATAVLWNDDLADNKVIYEKTYILKSDCSRGHGVGQYFDFNGNKTSSSSFVLGAGNIASGIAEIICSVYKKG